MSGSALLLHEDIAVPTPAIPSAAFICRGCTRHTSSKLSPIHAETLRHLQLRCLRYSSVSCRLNGERCRLQVTLACSPPWLASILSAIHDVADPVAMSIMSVRLLPQPFQNVSMALKKFDLCVSIQGISSMNMTFFRSEGNVSK